MKRVLLKDIAQKAGCSLPQASRALNGKPNVAPEIRAAVLRIARKLNYRNRANRHKPNIALLKKGTMAYYTGVFIYGIEKKLSKQNWTCQIVDELFINSVNDYFFDGVIAFPWGDYLAKLWPKLKSLPLIVVNDYGSSMNNICSIDPDFADEAKQVLGHLYSLGHRKIARIRIIEKEKFSQRYQERGENEYYEAASEFGRDFMIECINWNYNVNWTERLNELFPRGITAIIMVHQHYAPQIVSSIRKTGLHIPEDISLITEAVPCFSASADQTTFQLDAEKISQAAITQLTRLIRGKQVPLSVKVPSLFTVRGSTGPVSR